MKNPNGPSREEVECWQEQRNMSKLDALFDRVQQGQWPSPESLELANILAQVIEELQRIEAKTNQPERRT